MAKTTRQIKISKDELQKDKVLEWTDSVVFWLRSNSTLILSVIAVGFFVFGAVEFTKNRREATLRDATDRLFEAIVKFDDAVLEHPWGSPGRAQAMEEVRAMADEVVADFGGTEAARNALYLKANSYYFQGDPIGAVANTDRAIELFQEYADVAGQRGDPFERAAALHALGYAHENRWLLTVDDPDTALASLNAALDFYDQIRQIDGASFLRYEAMVAQARILAFLGREDDARELYREVLADRGRAVPELTETSSEREWLMTQVRQSASQFTSEGTARIQLQRLGMDPEEIDAIIAGQS